MTEIKVSDSVNSNLGFIERLNIYNELLLNQGYSKYDIIDLVINEDIDAEHEQVRMPTKLYLLSLKKILLYAIPVIAPVNTKRGLDLTASFPMDAFIYDSVKNKISTCNLAANDKYKFLGFCFPNELINNLPLDTYPYKYHTKLFYNCFEPISLEYLKEIETIDSYKSKTIYLVNPKFYENAQLYNKILELLYYGLKLYKTNSTIQVSNYYNSIKVTTVDDLIKFRLMIDHILIPPELNKLDIIDKLNKLLSKQINTNYYGSYYNVMIQTYNEYLYELIFLYGYNSNIVSKELENLKYLKVERSKTKENEFKFSTKKLLESKAEKITRELYPYLFSATDKRGIFIRFNKFSLSKLKKEYKDEVLIKLKKEDEYQKSIINNKCEHLDILKELNYADDINKPDIFTKLSAYINESNIVDNFYKCKNCQFNILCEHEFELLNAIKDITDLDHYYKVHQSILNKYKIIKQFDLSIENQENLFTFYCKYCFKELGKSEDIIQVDIGSNLGKYSSSESHIHKQDILNTTSDVLRKYVNITKLKFSQKVINKMISDLTYSYITEIAINIQKNKTLTNKEEVFKFHILIYVLISIIYININIANNKSTILKGGEDVGNSSAILKSEFKMIYSILKNDPLFKISGINEFKLKSLIIEYYRNINKVSSNVDTQEYKSSYSVISEIQQSPIYNYVKFILMLFTKKKNPSFSDIINKPQNILIDQISSSKNGKDMVTNIFDKIPEIKLPNNATPHLEYIYESYNDFRNYIISKEYASVKAYELNKKLEDYSKNQTVLLNLYKQNPYFFLPIENTRESNYSLDNLNTIYCVTGERHIWDNVFEINKSEIIYSKSDIQNLLSNDDYKNNKLKLIDKQCQLCKIRYSQANNKYNTEINNNIIEHNNKTAFFELYAVSCPEKDNHKYENNKCIQCGVTKLDILNQSNSYYKKYLNVYKNMRKKKIEFFIDQVNIIESELAKSEKSNNNINKLNLKIENLKSEITRIVTTLSKQFKLNSDSLLLLGISEGYDYDELLKDNRSNKLTHINSLIRREALFSYIKLINDYYYYIKNVEIQSKHYDHDLNMFVKHNLFKNSKKINISFNTLPFNTHNVNITLSDETLLYMLLYNIEFIMNNKSPELLQFAELLITKIIYQDIIKSKYDYRILKTHGAYVYDNIEIEDDVVDANLILEDEDQLFGNYGLDIDSDLIGEGDDVEDMDAKID